MKTQTLEPPRFSKRRWQLTFLNERWVFSLAFALGSVVAHADTQLGIDLQGIYGGGGISTNGGYSLVASIAATGSARLSGGGYVLTSGISGVYTSADNERPYLSLSWADTGLVISWPTSATGYKLEVSSKLGAATDWRPVSPAPAGHSFAIPVTSQTSFFRLRRSE